MNTPNNLNSLAQIKFERYNDLKTLEQNINLAIVATLKILGGELNKIYNNIDSLSNIDLTNGKDESIEKLSSTLFEIINLFAELGMSYGNKTEVFQYHKKDYNDLELGHIPGVSSRTNKFAKMLDLNDKYRVALAIFAPFHDFILDSADFPGIDTAYKQSVDLQNRKKPGTDEMFTVLSILNLFENKKIAGIEWEEIKPLLTAFILDTIPEFNFTENTVTVDNTITTFLEQIDEKTAAAIGFILFIADLGAGTDKPGKGIEQSLRLKIELNNKFNNGSLISALQSREVENKDQIAKIIVEHFVGSSNTKGEISYQHNFHKQLRDHLNTIKIYFPDRIEDIENELYLDSIDEFTNLGRKLESLLELQKYDEILDIARNILGLELLQNNTNDKF